MKKKAMKTVKTRKPKVSIAKPPKHTRRYVIWNEDGIGGSLIYLVGYCPDTLAYFMGLFLDAKKHVPSIDANDAICSKVKKSAFVQGFTLMTIKTNIKKRAIPGFDETQWNHLRIDAF